MQTRDSESDDVIRGENRGAGPLFLVFVIVLGAVALFRPGPFAAVRGAIVWLLGAVMLGMGLTLTPGDFRRVLKRPWVVLLGVSLQYFIMPLMAVLVSSILELDREATLGVILVGTSPGGTASNVIVYLARADVALSVTLTAVSTLLAPLATPFLTSWLAGALVDVPVWSLLVDVFKVVVGPVVAGIALRQLFPEAARKVAPSLVPLTSLIIALIIAIIIGATRPSLGASLTIVLPAVILHNTLGLSLGYALARLFRQPKRIARTLAIEVGMQNSGLAVALASKFFSAASALPGAIFSVWHNLSGAALASWWSASSGNSNDGENSREEVSPSEQKES